MELKNYLGAVKIRIDDLIPIPKARPYGNINLDLPLSKNKVFQNLQHIILEQSSSKSKPFWTFRHNYDIQPI